MYSLQHRVERVIHPVLRFRGSLCTFYPSLPNAHNAEHDVTTRGIVFIRSRTLISLRWPPLHKLLQILHRSDAQHKPPLLIRHDSKLLLPRTILLTTPEESLELLQRGLHGNDTVGAALALEPRHGSGELILGLDLAAVEEGL